MTTILPSYHPYYFYHTLKGFKHYLITQAGARPSRRPNVIVSVCVIYHTYSCSYTPCTLFMYTSLFLPFFFLLPFRQVAFLTYFTVARVFTWLLTLWLRSIGLRYGDASSTCCVYAAHCFLYCFITMTSVLRVPLRKPLNVVRRLAKRCQLTRRSNDINYLMLSSLLPFSMPTGNEARIASYC